MNLDSEHWRPCPIFPNRYMVSDDGRVYSVLNDMLIKPEVTAKGYYRYFLYEKGKERKAKAHRLVAMAFIPNPEGKPQIDHINGIKTDNRVSNLRWCSNRENANNPVTLAKNRASLMKRVKRMNTAKRINADIKRQGYHQVTFEDII